MASISAPPAVVRAFDQSPGVLPNATPSDHREEESQLTATRLQSSHRTNTSRREREQRANR